MRSILSFSEWNDVINRLYEIEYDWFGVDNLGQIAIFSSIGKGYIPTKAPSSYDKYIGLDDLMYYLPDITGAVVVMKEKRDNSYWEKQSTKGLFAYDYFDFLRKQKLEQYDLVSIPVTPLRFDSIPDIDSYIEIIPRFNLIFQNDISFRDLEQAEIMS